MRVLVVDPYYTAVLEQHYGSHPELAEQSYATQWTALMQLAFGTSDAYSFNLQRLGHEAHEIVPNCRPLQIAWAREHRPRLARLPWRLAAPSIVLAQTAWYRPDVVYMQSVGALHPVVLRLLRKDGRVLAGQLASRIPESRRVRLYDVIFTSFPHFVGRLGVPTHLLRLGFDHRVLGRLGAFPPDVDVAFVGQLGGHEHRPGNVVIETAARALAVDLWGPGVAEWPRDSPLRARHHGVVWGLEMYHVLARARISLNRHHSAAEGSANNMRLYEATGVGSMLLTDEAQGLDVLFEPGAEIVTYRDADDLVDKARWYLAHEADREAVASAGQARTLADHTYAARMQELSALLEPYLLIRSAASRG